MKEFIYPEIYSMWTDMKLSFLHFLSQRAEPLRVTGDGQGTCIQLASVRDKKDRMKGIYPASVLKLVRQRLPVRYLRTWANLCMG